MAQGAWAACAWPRSRSAPSHVYSLLCCAKQTWRAWQLGEGSGGAALLAGGGVIDNDDPDVVLGPRNKAIGFDGLLCASRGEAGGGGEAAPRVLHLDLQRIRWQPSARLLHSATL